MFCFPSIFWKSRRLSRNVVVVKNDDMESLRQDMETTKMKIRMMMSCIREIHVPVSSLTGLSDIVSTMDEDSSLYEHVAMMNAFGTYLANMIENMRLYYSLSSGTYESEMSDILLVPELRVMWENLMYNVNQSTQEKFTVRRTGEIMCSFSISDNVPNGIVSTDSLFLKHIFFAILHNAIRFTQVGSVKATVSSSTSGNGFCCLNLMVSDTGVGIPKDFRPCLFEPMTRAHSDMVHGGAGMSLSVARRLCRELGGDVVLVDKLSPGSTFHAYFQLKRMNMKNISSVRFEGWHDEQVIGSAHFPKNQNIFQNRNILENDGGTRVPRSLVVDNITLNQDILRHNLVRIGIDVATASDGEEAFARCCETQFDIIFMDIHMPKMNGLLTCEKIRNECDLNRNTPIIALTGIASPEIVKNGISIGMTHTMSKPVQYEDLVNVVNQYMKKHKSKKTIHHLNA